MDENRSWEQPEASGPALELVASPSSVREQLRKILASESFSHTDRLARFFQFVVEETLSGDGEALKEYRVALEVFDRPASFDPKTDSVVRVAARQLRSKLREYYEGPGKDDAVLIDLPKGRYVPSFAFRMKQDSPAGPPSSVSRSRFYFRLASAVVLCAAALCGAVYFIRKTAGSRDARSMTVAVLPFDNYSTEPDNAVFCDGLVEELTTRLANLESFRVLARASSSKFKSEQDPIVLARKLRVDALIEGSVSRSGNKLRVSAQLIDTTDGYHLWSESYERVAEDAFGVQDEIVSNIVKALRTRTNASQAASLHRPPNPEAVRFYWLGRYTRRQRTPDALHKSAGYLEESVRLDPNYPQAWAGLADVYATMGFHETSGASPTEYVAKARAAASKALELDANLAEAYATQASLSFYYDTDWPRAEREYLHALRLNPSYARAHYSYALGLASRARLDEAVRESRRALELDPLSYTVGNDVGVIYYVARRYEEAIECGRQTLAADSTYAAAHALLGCCYSAKGNYPGAVDEFQKAIAGSERYSYLLGHLGRNLALSGRGGVAQELLEELINAPDKSSVSFVHVAYIHDALKQPDRALDCLEKAIDRHDADVVFMRVDPTLDGLRGSPRFGALLRKAGLED